MSTSMIRPALLAALAAVAAACSTMPEKTSLLDRTHADYAAAQSDPNVARYAPLEMKRATDALAAADAAAAQHEGVGKIDQLAYLSKQQIAVAMEVAKEKIAVAEQESATAQLEQIRLAQRTQEAEKAKRSAELSKRNADQSQLEARVARSDATEAQRAADAAKAKNAQLEAELADLSAKQTARGLVITLGDVLFGTDQANLTADGTRSAQKLADILQQHPERTVLVEGYTDSTGSARHNQELSERRARSVRTALQSMGIAPNRISARGYGQSNPVASNASAAERQLNRRVEIVLSDESGKTVLR